MIDGIQLWPLLNFGLGFLVVGLIFHLARTNRQLRDLRCRLQTQQRRIDQLSMTSDPFDRAENHDLRLEQLERELWELREVTDPAWRERRMDEAMAMQ